MHLEWIYAASFKLLSLILHVAHMELILMDPSSRMQVPFSMGFSMIVVHKSANSCGLPNLRGKGTCLAKLSRAFSGSILSIGVRNSPGATHTHRTP
mmetsp:Transcript_8496/g.31444  ORF Transcript_8496/g.31444 Transcript_8496/m.31444 type:complete len:96 (+) Transcript_8496:186-473(+)